LNTYLREHLYCGARHPQPPDAIADTFGFRVVLARMPLKPDSNDEPAPTPTPAPAPPPEPPPAPAEAAP